MLKCYLTFQMSNQMKRRKRTEPRQRPISVTSKEREVLERRKHLYETSTGRKGDWGEFLDTIVLLGLAATGVYTLVKAIRRSEQSVDFTCGECEKTFVMAVPSGVGQAVYTTCPHCSAELVVDINM